VNIQEVLRTINQMRVDGVIERYAIGGAVGATFYLEPVDTLDAERFQQINARHALVDRWQQFQRQFLEP
jgi:tetrahydromethanopterin S-methyltransferase subunit A